MLPLAVAACGLSPCLVSAQNYDPLPVRNYRPFSLLFLRFEPNGLLLAKGDRTLDVSFAAANSLTYVPERLSNPVLREDIEADRLDLRYRQGLGKGWEIGVEVPVEDLGGGFMDPIIEWYHRTFLRLDNIRNDIPFGGHVVSSPAGPTSTGGFGIGDISGYLRREIARRTTLEAGLKLPTGNSAAMLGSGNADAGLYAETWLPLIPRFRATVGLGAVAQGRATRYSGTRGLAAQENLTIVFAPNSRDSWIAEYGREDSGLKMGISQSDQVHPSMTFGYRRQISKKSTLSAYFTEDVDLFNPNLPTGAEVGPDFVFGLEYRVKL